MKIRRIAFTLLATLGVTGVAFAEGSYLLRVSTPLLVSGGGILRFGPADGAYHPGLSAEIGVGGGKVAVGMDNHGGGTLGFGFRGALVHTWLEPLDVDEDQTFLGIELEMSAKRLLFSAGGYHRISDGEDDWLGSIGIGILF